MFRNLDIMVGRLDTASIKARKTITAKINLGRMRNIDMEVVLVILGLVLLCIIGFVWIAAAIASIFYIGYIIFDYFRDTFYYHRR